jgi:hypothetical protein
MLCDIEYHQSNIIDKLTPTKFQLAPTQFEPFIQMANSIVEHELKT